MEFLNKTLVQRRFILGPNQLHHQLDEWLVRLDSRSGSMQIYLGLNSKVFFPECTNHGGVKDLTTNYWKCTEAEILVYQRSPQWELIVPKPSRPWLLSGSLVPQIKKKKVFFFLLFVLNAGWKRKEWKSNGHNYNNQSWVIGCNGSWVHWSATKEQSGQSCLQSVHIWRDQSSF